jgi:hypothetical protein
MQCPYCLSAGHTDESLTRHVFLNHVELQVSVGSGDLTTAKCKCGAILRSAAGEFSTIFKNHSDTCSEFTELAEMLG